MVSWKVLSPLDGGTGAPGSSGRNERRTWSCLPGNWQVLSAGFRQERRRSRGMITDGEITNLAGVALRRGTSTEPTRRVTGRSTPSAWSRPILRAQDTWSRAGRTTPHPSSTRRLDASERGHRRYDRATQTIISGAKCAMVHRSNGESAHETHIASSPVSPEP